MGVFDRRTGHEQVVFCHDPGSGLRAIIAIYSTALGPALGGTRFYPYACEAEALDDVLRLSRAMAYKAACAGLDLGGGKAVIIGDPATDKTEALLRAYGRFVESLAAATSPPATSAPTSRTWTSSPGSTRFVTGRSPAHGGAGDSSILTAFGVFQGMRAAARALWGAPDPARAPGRRRRRRQGRPPPGRAPARRRRRLVVARRRPRGGRPRCARGASRGRRRSPTSTRCPRRRWTSTRRARWAGRSTTTPSPRCRRRSSAARPTTSSPTRAIEQAARRARDPLRARLRRQRRRPDPGRRRDRGLRVRARARAQARRDLRHDGRDLRASPRRRACRRRWPPTASPSAG